MDDKKRKRAMKMIHKYTKELVDSYNIIENLGDSSTLNSYLNADLGHVKEYAIENFKKGNELENKKWTKLKTIDEAMKYFKELNENGTDIGYTKIDLQNILDKYGYIKVR